MDAKAAREIAAKANEKEKPEAFALPQPIKNAIAQAAAGGASACDILKVPAEAYNEGLNLFTHDELDALQEWAEKAGYQVLVSKPENKHRTVRLVWGEA